VAGAGPSVTQAQAREGCSAVTAIGVDETACWRSHHYITLVNDLAERLLIFATPGRDAQTLRQFSEVLADHHGQSEQIRHASIDMSKAYISGLGQHLPNAEITFDWFHIIQLANQAVNAVREAEVRHDARLKRTKWARLKDMARWSKKQDEAFYDLNRSN
jgi:transposase